MGRRKGQPVSPETWKRLPEADLLQMRVRDLGLRIEGSPLEPRVQQLYDELSARGIGFHPACYLADEWLCPDKVPIIGIPFYLAHPRLTKLEKRMMLEAEGATEASCMKILRHEAGHALNYAYRLFRRTRWRQLFGPFTTRYSERYDTQPYSKRYVTHLGNNYAQAHPDEDFAETFAVWLTPGSRWQERYQGWPAYAKLRYVDYLMRQIGPRPPLVAGGETPWQAARKTSTLEAYYRRKRRHLGEEFPGYYDPGLSRLFSDRPGTDPPETAAHLLRRWRRRLVDVVGKWTGHRKFDIDKLIGKLIRRCAALRLYVRAGETETISEATSFITAIMNNVNPFAEGP